MTRAILGISSTMPYSSWISEAMTTTSYGV